MHTGKHGLIKIKFEDRETVLSFNDLDSIVSDMNSCVRILNDQYIEIINPDYSTVVSYERIVVPVTIKINAGSRSL